MRISKSVAAIMSGAALVIAGLYFHSSDVETAGGIMIIFGFLF